MRQLYEKSGSVARLSDFAIDVRKAVEANALPEYTLAGVLRGWSAARLITGRFG
jgi:hypothetical protein